MIPIVPVINNGLLPLLSTSITAKEDDKNFINLNEHIDKLAFKSNVFFKYLSFNKNDGVYSCKLLET